MNRVPALTIVCLQAALLALSAAGCGLARCDVSGKVTYQGKAIVCGCILLVGADGLPITANLSAEGEYEAKQVPVGKVDVAVYSLDPARARDPEQARGAEGDLLDKRNWMNPEVDRSKWFPIPRRYEMVQTSGLSAELKRGQNTVDFDLQ